MCEKSIEEVLKKSCSESLKVFEVADGLRFAHRKLSHFSVLAAAPKGPGCPGCPGCPGRASQSQETETRSIHSITLRLWESETRKSTGVPRNYELHWRRVRVARCTGPGTCLIIKEHI